MHPSAFGGEGLNHPSIGKSGRNRAYAPCTASDLRCENFKVKANMFQVKVKQTWTTNRLTTIHKCEYININKLAMHNKHLVPLDHE